MGIIFRIELTIGCCMNAVPACRRAKVMCSKLGANRQVNKGFLSRISRTMYTDYLWHSPARVTSMSLVNVCGELKWLSGGTQYQADLLPRATAKNSCRKNIGLSKLFADSTLYCKLAERFGILSYIGYSNKALSIMYLLFGILQYVFFINVYKWITTAWCRTYFWTTRYSNVYLCMTYCMKNKLGTVWQQKHLIFYIDITATLTLRKIILAIQIVMQDFSWNS
jgi:hypothetical protein